MNSDSKRINNEFKELVSNIPEDEIKEISDMIRTLFEENDVEGYKQKCVEHRKLIEKMNHSQHENCICKESTAYYATFYDVYLLLVKEHLESIFSKTVNASVMEKVEYHLCSYEKTQDKYSYLQARNLLKESYMSSENIRTPDGIKNLEKYIKILESNTDLPEEYKEELDYLKQYIDNYNLKSSINEGVDFE
jgi:hypothetical protein